MKTITARPYQILRDHMSIYQFMLELYERDWQNGVPAPFLEYALSSSWMDKTYTYLNRIWFDSEKIVAFCFSESPVTDIYFSLRPGYEELAPEMIAYADQNMPNFDGNRQFILFQGQQALIRAAQQAGYVQTGSDTNLQYDFEKPLDYPLPAGFRFVPAGEQDINKIAECCWKGFDHEAEHGPWDPEADTWNHHAKNNHQIHVAPHATPEYDVIIENDSGEYVCYAGMWWTPENKLAYLEPLCTVPDYRHMGLAAAALSEHYRRMNALGATHMTGGSNPFYEKIGYHPAVTWTFWKKLC